MSKHFSPEEDKVIFDCAKKAQQAGEPATKGFETAAQRLNKSYDAVARRYYKLRTQIILSKESKTEKAVMFPKSRRMFSNREDAVILECVAEACKTGSSITKGLRAAAQKLNKSYNSVEHRSRKIKNKNSTRSTPTIREALEEMIGKGEIPPADKEKLTKVAQLTGEHYHTVLSTFGAISACGSLASKEPCDMNCPWRKAAAVSRMYDDGMPLNQIATWAGMSKEDVDMYIKAHKEGNSTEKENMLLKSQIEQKNAEIVTLNSDLKTQKREMEQYQIILDALAQELGIRNWDGRPTVYFANEIYNKLTKLIAHYNAAHKLGIRLLKKMIQKNAGIGIAQTRYGSRQEAQLH